MPKSTSLTETKFLSNLQREGERRREERREGEREGGREGQRTQTRQIFQQTK
jgi:hypothetical protein